MTDRTSARTFGAVLRHIADSGVTDESRALAKKVYVLALRHDFTPDDMDADSALLAFGLAKTGRDPYSDPEDPDEAIYLFVDYEDDEDDDETP